MISWSAFAFLVHIRNSVGVAEDATRSQWVQIKRYSCQKLYFACVCYVDRWAMSYRSCSGFGIGGTGVSVAEPPAPVCNKNSRRISISTTPTKTPPPPRHWVSILSHHRPKMYIGMETTSKDPSAWVFCRTLVKSFSSVENHDPQKTRKPPFEEPARSVTSSFDGEWCEKITGDVPPFDESGHQGAGMGAQRTSVHSTDRGRLGYSGMQTSPDTSALFVLERNGARPRFTEML